MTRREQARRAAQRERDIKRRDLVGTLRLSKRELRDYMRTGRATACRLTERAS